MSASSLFYGGETWIMKIKVDLC